MKKLIAAVVGMVVALALSGAVLAATYTNNTTSTSYQPAFKGPNPVVGMAFVEFAKIHSGAGAVSNDTIKIMGIPAGAKVMNVTFCATTTNTPSGLTTFNLGDTTDPVRYYEGGDMAATTYVAATNAAYLCTSNVFMTVTPQGTFTDGKLKVWATIVLPPATPAVQGVAP